jgi:hypothetical protein
MDAIGYYIMIGLLVAGAAYGLANKGKPRATASKSTKRIAFICFGVALGCGVLALAVGLLASHPAQH